MAGYGLDTPLSAGPEIFIFSTSSGVHPTTLPMGNGSSFPEVNWSENKLTTHLQMLLRFMNALNFNLMLLISLYGAVLKHTDAFTFHFSDIMRLVNQHNLNK